jgi:hypothetical protein
MSAFDSFMTNEVILYRQDGTSQSFKCNIQSTGITIQDPSIKVTEGDEIHHVNPAGVNEVYEVDEVIYNTPENFPKDMHHISIKYTKVGSKKHKNQNSGNTYNLVNSNLAINSDNTSQENAITIDLSEVVINDPEVIQKVNELQEELNKENKDQSKIKRILIFLLSKAPDVLISITTGLLIK